MTRTQLAGFEDVRRLLNARGVHHAIVEHEQTFTAGAEARIAAVDPTHAAKAVMTRDAEGYVLAILPASERLDLRKLRRAASRRELRLATEAEMAHDFPQFEVGALPPFGELFDCPELIDGRLLGLARILCNGGDHRHSIVVNPRELRFAAGSGVADLVDQGQPRPARPSAR